MVMHVSVVSPEESLFEGEASFVRAETVEGEIGILAGHTPLLAQLVDCEVKITSAGGGDELIHIGGGFMTVKDDKVIILAEELGDPE